MAEVRVGSLVQAIKEIIVDGRTHDRRLVNVAGLRPRDVAALDDVILRSAKEKPFGDKRWKLADGDGVRKVKGIAEILVVLERVLLPSLAYEDGRALIGNGVLNKYVDVLSSLANDCAAGDFASNVKVLCARLRHYIHTAAAVVDEALLHPLVDALMKDVTAILDNLAFPERATDAAPVNEPLASNEGAPAPGRRRRTSTTTTGIRPSSLDTAFKDMAISASTHSRRNVWVSGLCSRDVFALLTVAKIAHKYDKRWKVVNGRRLQRMEQAVGVLLVLEAALLPALAEYPNDTARLLAAIRIYAIKLSTHARGAGGSFSIEAQALSNTITEFVTNLEDAAASDGSEAEADGTDDAEADAAASDGSEVEADGTDDAEADAAASDGSEVEADGTDDAEAGDAAADETDDAEAGDTGEAAAAEKEQKLKALVDPLIAEVTRLLRADVTVSDN